MAPLSQAERAKRYREKNKEKVRERDALRKKLKRIVMKVNDPEKNRARLVKERLYKQEYRKRIRSNIDEQPSPTSNSTVEGFSQRSSYMKSLKKAKRSLPKSPRRRNAVVSSLAKKFQLQILPQQNNRGRPKEILDADEKSWLIDFLDRHDITYTMPGKRDQVYMGKVNGKKVYETKKYFLWTLNELLNIANGCEATGIQPEDSFVSHFGKKLSFRHLYELIKRNKQYIYNKNIPHATCLCEICENAVYLMQDLNKCLPKELHLPTNPHDKVEEFSCDSDNEASMNSKCNICKLPEKIPESGGFETDDINIEDWKLVDRRAQKVFVSINVQEVSSRFNTHVQILKCHIHEKRIQHTAFNNVKANLQILIQVDYSEITLTRIKVKFKVRTLAKNHFRYLLPAATSKSMA